MMFKRILLVLSMVLLSSCRTETLPFKVGINMWPGYEPLYMAEDQGLYPNVEVVRLASTLDVLRALRNGNLQAAGLTLDETLVLAQEGIDLVVVLVMNYSDGADVVVAAPQIQTLQDVRGKRVGVELNAVGALMLEGLLEKSGLTRAEVQVASMSVSQMAEAWREGNIDVAVTYEPYLSELKTAGMVEVFSSAQMPGQIIDVLAVRRDALQNAEGLQELMAGYFSVRDFMRKHPREAEARMAADLGLEVPALQAHLDGLHLPDLLENRRLFRDGTLLETAVRLQRFMREAGLLKADLEMARYIDGRWVDGVQR